MRASDRILESLSGSLDRLGALSDRFPMPVDAALALATLLVSFAGLSAQHRLGPLSAAFGLALTLPLPLRRRHPIAAFGLVSFLLLGQWFLDVPQLADASVLFSLYWIARGSSATGVLGATAVTEAGAIMAAARWSPSDPVKVWVGLTALAAAATLLGISARQRRALLASLRERAARLELERDREGQLGAAAERARIAREMHDIVSHNLTVMIALADAAGYAMDSTPEQASAALERVSSTGRQALAEMRRLLGILRDEPHSEPLEPQPTLRRLDELLARVEAAGLPVSLECRGDPHTLDPGKQLTIYRVVQEALTNTLKHAAGPHTALVRLDCTTSGGVTLEILDDGRAPAAASTRTSPYGRGLEGMRERATAYGGTIVVGPGPEGGWSVRLTLDGADPSGKPA